MTDEEYDQLARSLQLAAPSQLAASAQAPSASTPLLSGSPTQLAQNMPSVLPVSGAPGASSGPGSSRAAQGLTGILAPPAVTPAEDTTHVGQPGDLDRLIDYRIKQRTQDYNEDQSKLREAIHTLYQNVDATDEERNQAQRVTQAARVAPPFGQYQGLINQSKDDLDTPQFKQLQRDAYAATLMPGQTGLEQYTNLQMGPSYEALQQLGIEHPGITGKYATAPVFQPAAPPPAQKIQRALPVPGQTIDPATGKVVQAPASSIGLTTVRGTEFGEVDNPARGGYSEAGWNVGARGANLAGKDTEGIALPYAVLNKYGNTSDKDFISNFNSKYDVQVVDTKTGKVVSAPLVDYGPGAKTGAGIDMLWKTRESLGLPVNYSGNISYRVVPKGSALPDNTTASVAQTTQTTTPATAATAATAATGQFQTGTNPYQVFIKPIDRSKIRDPSVAGPRMNNQELMDWARSQTDDYATAMANAGAPITVEGYREQFAKYAESAQKFHDQKEDLKPIPQDWQDQFNSLSSLVSPTGTVGTDGKPTSQLDLALALRNKAAGHQLEPMNQDVRNYNAQQGHLVSPIARGVFSMKGTLNEFDMRQAQEGLPTLWDTPEGAAWKVNTIRQAARDQMRRIIQIAKSQYHDTSGLEAEYRRIFGAPKEAQEAGFTKTSGVLTANKPGAQTAAAPPAQNPRVPVQLSPEYVGISGSD